MKFKDDEAKRGWAKGRENNKDPYGNAVFVYAEKWAELMEKALGEGEILTEVAGKLSHDADADGITGFMYGAAAATLAGCWKFGEELRKWHNLDTQINDEGEKANKGGTVLNPALMTIESKG